MFAQACLRFTELRSAAAAGLLMSSLIFSQTPYVFSDFQETTDS
jgi:hypothetical protein